ncbi:unnamed protein product [Vitrella brassicaformis CCMP3155]|uniref:Splicing factor YJU2 n=2 Tax=Vitrella brassicaformis TaxID=1169539 RepID=A0A0G4EJ03_VITBC|nr:unnamed protein product [Vitrella brassicaformis CCMP3155]|mmetsp:Transcript_14911/g.35563  ORF Transcript_14911/g.35563 Transcript_14911/m.35563 type:complete len:343 (+) Transcript_14911:175-1203(+)|eukprot:CEL96681.1 unnamed protein product [Vitrella brassicaformis CCMP3155]
MGERKVLNKYYPPDFDPVKLRTLRDPSKVREKRKGPRLFNVRMMFPFTFCCNTCGDYVYIGTKFNSRVEKVQGEDYLGIAVWRFYGRCPNCRAEVAFKTDPQHADYILETGGKRNYQAYLDADILESQMKEKHMAELEGDSMKALEHKQFNTQQEIQTFEDLDEVRKMNKRLMSRDDTISEALQFLEERSTATVEADWTADEEAELEAVRPLLGVKRLAKEEEDDDDHEAAAAPRPQPAPSSSSAAAAGPAKLNDSNDNNGAAGASFAADNGPSIFSRISVVKRKAADSNSGGAAEGDEGVKRQKAADAVVSQGGGGDVCSSGGKGGKGLSELLGGYSDEDD